MSVLKHIIYGLIFVVLLFQSCSVEKRHYTSGYHLQWKNNKSNASVAQTKKGNKEIKDTPLSNPNTDINSLTASAENKKGIVLLTPDSVRCDTLIMRDGTEIKAKVMEITPTEIKYKFCNNIDGPMHIIHRYNASYIKYANGTMDSFVNEHPSVNQQGNRNNNNYNNGTYNKNNGYYGQNNGGYNQNNAPYSGAGYAVNEWVRKNAMASLILGILSFFLYFLGIISAIFAIVLGYKCLKLIKQDPENLWMYSKRATAGVILGWIVLALYLIILIALIAALSVI